MVVTFPESSLIATEKLLWRNVKMCQVVSHKDMPIDRAGGGRRSVEKGGSTLITLIGLWGGRLTHCKWPCGAGTESFSQAYPTTASVFHSFYIYLSHRTLLQEKVEETGGSLREEDGKKGKRRKGITSPGTKKNLQNKNYRGPKTKLCGTSKSTENLQSV